MHGRDQGPEVDDVENEEEELRQMDVEVENNRIDGLKEEEKFAIVEMTGKEGDVCQDGVKDTKVNEENEKNRKEDQGNEEESKLDGSYMVESPDLFDSVIIHSDDEFPDDHFIVQNYEVMIPRVTLGRG